MNVKKETNEMQTHPTINDLLNVSNSDFETKFMSKDAYEAVTPEIAKLEQSNKFMKITNLQK